MQEGTVRAAADVQKPPDAVVVSRPTRWGNPYPVAGFGREEAVALFRRYLADHPELVEAARQELAGKDLACWCKPNDQASMGAQVRLRHTTSTGRPMHGASTSRTVRRPWLWAITP